MVTRRRQSFSGQRSPPKQIPFYSSGPTPTGWGPPFSAGNKIFASPSVPPFSHCISSITLHPGSYLLPHERIHLQACPPLCRRGPRDASDPSFEAISSLRHGEVPPSCPVVVHRHPRDPSSQPPHDTRPCSACPGPQHSRPRPGLGPDRATPLAPLPPLCAPRTGTDAWLQSLPSPGAARPAPAEPQAPPATVTGPGPRRPQPSGTPRRRFLTSSDQGGSAASEANSEPGPLGHSSHSSLHARRPPAPTRIFLHLDPAPDTAGTGN